MELPSTSSSSGTSSESPNEKELCSLKRKLEMKQLLETGRDLENNMEIRSTGETLEIIKNLITKSDIIQKEVGVEDRLEHTTEIVMDVQVLKMNHELVSRVFKRVQVFDFSMCRIAVERIIRKDDKVNWDNLAEFAYDVAQTVFSKPSLLGIIDDEVTEQVVKEKRKTKRQLLDKEVRPETLSNIGSMNKVSNKVTLIQKQLKAYSKMNNINPFPFYKVVIDPNDFMRSVQNIFHLSFLARDNVIGIEKGINGHPYVRLLEKKDRVIKDVETSQAICSLTYAIWKKLIEFYKIETPVLDIDAEDTAECGEND